MIKKYRTFLENLKVKNITKEDIIQCIKSTGKVIATIIKNFPDNVPDEPLRPVSIDEDGLVTVDFEGKEYEVELRNIEKCDF